MGIINKDTIDIQPYYQPFASERSGYNSHDDVLIELYRVLEGISKRNKKILITISGGVDSRLLAIACNQLGIPFDAVTLAGRIGKSDEGSDFIIAAKICEVLEAKHISWEWKGDRFLDDTKKLIISSGGMNDAYTTYPDGMDSWSDIASGYDCTLRGDESFGWGPTSYSLHHALHLLNINSRDDLERISLDNNKLFKNLEIFKLIPDVEMGSIPIRGIPCDIWKNRFYWHTRIPRYVMPIARWQTSASKMEFPYLEKNFLCRMESTHAKNRNDKKIIREALKQISRKKTELAAIPISYSDLFSPSEPFLNLSKQTIEGVIDTIRLPSKLNQLMDKNKAIELFRSSIGKDNNYSRQRYVHYSYYFNSLPVWVRNMSKLICNMLNVYPKTIVRPEIILKRIYALQVYLLYAEKSNG